MNKHIRYSLLLTLALVMTVSLVKAQNPAIGQSPQARPYESNPTVASFFDVGIVLTSGVDAMKDGSLLSSGDFALGAPHVLRPNANSAVAGRQAWTVAPVGLLHYFAWKEETSDADSTYLSAAANSLHELSELDDPPASASGTITGVRVTVVARRTGGDDQIRLMLRLGTLETFSHTTGGIFPASGATAYATYSFTVARPGGSSWTWADITSLQAGVQSFMVGTTFTAVRVTQLYVEVLGPTTGYFEFSTFTNTPADPLFTTIGWVDIKMSYMVASALVDDTYTIEYNVAGGAMQPLQAATSDAFDSGGGQGNRPWTNVAEPTDGTWDWTDIGGLAIKISVNQGGGAWDGGRMFLFEVWVTVYETAPTLDVGQATVSLQPSVIGGLGVGQGFFIDIYIRNVLKLWGYQFAIKFDPAVINAVEYFSYYIFDTQAPTGFDNTLGWANISYTSFGGDIVGASGDMPLARYYFTVVGPGSTKLAIPEPRDTQTSVLPEAGTPNTLPHTTHEAFFSTPRIMSFNGGLLPVPPVPPLGGTWHELYPTYSTTWTLTSWTDNGDGYLSASDQIDMTIPGWVYWFHVDQVTITIHWTYKSPDTGTADAETEFPMTEMPVGSGGNITETRWHMVYPTYSRTFTITSWEDNGDGSFTPSDQFDFVFDDDPATTHWAHLDSVTTDIWVSQKGEPEPGGVPEFPLGIGVLMSLVALIPVIYTWRTRPKKKVA